MTGINDNRMFHISLKLKVKTSGLFLKLKVKTSDQQVTHVAKLGEITGKTRVLYSELWEITGKTRVMPCG